MRSSRRTISVNTSRTKPTKTIGEYLLQETIGEGTFGIVKLCKHIPTSSIYAVKILPKAKQSSHSMLLINRELSILPKLKHQNVIELREIITTKDYFYIIMEYCDSGELFKLVSESGRLCEEDASFYFYQMINGVEFLHSQSISHRDLKLENVLMTHAGLIKLIDFGLSNYFTENVLLKSTCGSPSYAAPEMLLGKGYDGRAIDLWCCGIILYAMVTGHFPFNAKDEQSLYRKITSGDYGFPKGISLTLKDILKKLLETDYKERITIDKIKGHLFYIKGRNIFNRRFAPKRKIKSVSVLQSQWLSDNDNDNEEIVSTKQHTLTKSNKKVKDLFSFEKKKTKMILKGSGIPIKTERDITPIKEEDNKSGDSTNCNSNIIKCNKDFANELELKLKHKRDAKKNLLNQKDIIDKSLLKISNAQTPIQTNKYKTKRLMTKFLMNTTHQDKSKAVPGFFTERGTRNATSKDNNTKNNINMTHTNFLHLPNVNPVNKMTEFTKKKLENVTRQPNCKVNNLIITINSLKKRIVEGYSPIKKHRKIKTTFI